MAARVARNRAAALALLLAIALGVLAAMAYATSTTSAAIDAPTGNDPEPGGPFGMDELSQHQTSLSVWVSGYADPDDDITVEGVIPGEYSTFCYDTAGEGDGQWGCEITFITDGAFEVQAYREGGAYIEDFDSQWVFVVENPSFDEDADPVYWNAYYDLEITGQKGAGSDIAVDIDGDGDLCEPIPDYETATVWGCSVSSVGEALPDGEYTITVTASVTAEDGPYLGTYVGTSITKRLVVDTVAPGMAALSWPLAVGAQYQGTSGPLPRVTVSDLWPWFEGSGEPGATVHVAYLEGDDRDGQLWEYAYDLCEAVVEPDGWWGCGGGWVYPGTTWTVGTWQEDRAGNATPWAGSSAQVFVDYVEGPVAAVITLPGDGATVVGPNVTISGTGAVGDLIVLSEDLGGEDDTFYCGDEGWNFPVVGGMWSCTISGLPYGQHTLTATAVQNWGDGYYEWGGSDAVTFTLVAPATPAGPTSPTTTRAPLSWSFQLTDAAGNPVNVGDIKTGDRIFIHATGLPAGATVSAELHSTPIPLGTAVVDSAGVLAMPIVIPADVEPGQHNVVVTLTPLDGEPSTVTAPVIVAGEADETLAAVDEEPTEEPSGDEGASGGVIRTAGGGGADAAQPSTFSSTLQTFSEVRITPSTVATAAVLAVALIVFVSLPAELLQSTLGANYARAFSWLTPLRARGRRLRERVPSWLTDGRVGGGITVAATALILGFADPTFTWNAPSFRLWAALFASLFIVNVVVLAIVRSIAQRRYSVSSWLDPMPAALIVVALSVLVSRLAHIEPGFLFGLVVGVVFARELRKAEDGKLAMLATGVLIAFGIGAWLLFSLLPAEGGVGVQFARDLLAATTLESLSTLLVALLPLAFLEGRTIFAWSKAVWAGVYVAAVTAFVIIVVPMSDSWGDVSAPLFGWVTLFAVFGIVAMAVWALFRFIPERQRSADSVEAGASTE